MFSYFCRLSAKPVRSEKFPFAAYGLLTRQTFLPTYVRFSRARSHMFQAVRHAVNVLNVSKYPPNAKFRNANINAQRANVTGSTIWHTNRRPPM